MSLEIKPLVDVHTGEIITPAYIEDTRFSRSWYSSAEITKAGIPDQRKSGRTISLKRDSRAYYNGLRYVYYDPDKEARASILREKRKALLEEVRKIEGQIVDVYLPEVAL